MEEPMEPVQSFIERAFSRFCILFSILAVVGFLAKVKQGWSLLEWLRVEGIGLVFAAGAALIWTLMLEEHEVGGEVRGDNAGAGNRAMAKEEYEARRREARVQRQADSVPAARVRLPSGAAHVRDGVLVSPIALEAPSSFLAVLFRGGASVACIRWHDLKVPEKQRSGTPFRLVHLSPDTGGRESIIGEFVLSGAEQSSPADLHARIRVTVEADGAIEVFVRAPDSKQRFELRTPGQQA
jgi:hypothetical protein